jgi:hypothetical protein
MGIGNLVGDDPFYNPAVKNVKSKANIICSDALADRFYMLTGLNSKFLTFSSA